MIKGRLQCFFCLVPLLPLSTTHANAARSVTKTRPKKQTLNNSKDILNKHNGQPIEGEAEIIHFKKPAEN